MSAKHTPGPWFVDNHNDWMITVQHGPAIPISENLSKLQVVCTLPAPKAVDEFVPATFTTAAHTKTIVDQADLDLQLANAQLIAAAPWLLEALLELHFVVPKGTSHIIDIKLDKALKALKAAGAIA